MSKMPIYLNGGENAKKNKTSQVIDLKKKTYACGIKGMQDANNAKQKKLKEVGLAAAAPFGIWAGIEAAGLGMGLMNAGTSMVNGYRITQELADLVGGATAWGGGFVAFGAGLTLCVASAYVGAKMVKKLRCAYQNSTIKQKVDPVMRKVGVFLSKNAQRAAEKVIEHLPEKAQRMIADKTLTDNDIMHKGKYHHTAEQGGHRIKEFQVKLNKYREGY